MAEKRTSKKDLFAAVEAPAILREDSSVVIKPCALCGRQGGRRLYMQAHFPVVRCGTCGLVYADEHFRDEDLREFYTGDYYQRAYVCHPAEIDRKITEEYCRAFGRVDRLAGGGRLLDFGCARGTFLEEAARRGFAERWRLEGIDINPDEVRMGHERGVSIFCGNLEQAAWPADSFDAITAFSVLEHLQDPIGVMRQLASVLRPGGLLLAVVPAGGCLIVNLAILLARMLGDRVRGFTDNVFPEEHLYYFTEQTMARALELSGFEPVSFFHEPSYLETHPPSPLVAVAAYGLRLCSFVTRRQTMLGVVARRGAGPGPG